MIKKLLNKKIGGENKKGFTLAELLIVVAIIGVLVAISIPIFTTQLEKSREAVDASNLRAAYAEVMSDVVAGAATIQEKKVDQKQTKAGWDSTVDWPDGFASTDIKAPVDGASTDYWTVKWDATNEKIVAS